MNNITGLQKANAASNKITKDSIKEAFLVLLVKKDISKITITEIVSKAGVSRTAFYKNYKTKEDILHDIVGPFLQAINNIRNSSFLKGQNNRNWTITFDWLIKPNNFIKVLEGNYDDKENKGGFNNESRGNTSKNNEPSKGKSEEDEYGPEYWEEQNRILNEGIDF